MLSAFLMLSDKFVLHSQIYLHNCTPCSKFVMMQVVHWRI